MDGPTADEVFRALTLRGGFNSTVVTVGTALFGFAAGVVGTLGLLRRRALLGEAVAHASLPGICLAFLSSVLLFGTGGDHHRSLGVLLLGAAVTSGLAVAAVGFISRATRLTQDAAIAAVLSVSFGVGVVLLSVIQGMESGGQAGLSHLIFGQTAAMRRGDAELMGVIALVVLVVVVALLKELRMIAFDEEYARVGGWPVARVDLLMLAMIVLVTLAGLPAVGVLLAVAMLILPAAAARLWTDRLGVMVLVAGSIGAASGYLGASLSALLPDQPAGAVIVLTGGALFGGSLLLAPRRGLLSRLRGRDERRVEPRALLTTLRGMERAHGGARTAAALSVASGRSPSSVRAELASATRDGLVAATDGGYRLTERGRRAAAGGGA